MVEFEDLCKQVLTALLFNYSSYMNSGQKDLDAQHEVLTQRAIIERLRQLVGKQKGYANKNVLSQAFRELEIKGWITSQEGKQKAKLYFPTEEGQKQGDILMNTKTKEIKCLIDGANVAHYPNRERPTLTTVTQVFQALHQQSFFGFCPVTIHIVMKPAIRHYLPEAEQELFGQLEKQGVLIQSFRGSGSIDDEQILRLIEDFQQLGHEVWIVTNDRYRDHLEYYPWYKDYKRSIEYRIVDDLVQFNPANAEKEKIQDRITEPGSVKIVKIGHIPQDSTASHISEPTDFVQMVQVQNVKQVFVTQVRDNLRLWFINQGRTFVHGVRGKFEEINSLDDYLEAVNAQIFTREDYHQWKRGKLAEKGWPTYRFFKEIQKKLLEINSSVLGLKVDPEIAGQLERQLAKVQSRLVSTPIEHFPAYQALCVKEIDWYIWLVAKENGWQSFTELVDVLYKLTNFDMFAEDPRFISMFWRYLALKTPTEIKKDLPDRAAFRTRFWDTYSVGVKPDPKYFFNFITGRETSSHVSDSQIDESSLFQKLEEKHKRRSFDTQLDLPDMKVNETQYYLYLKIKENGWTSYQQFLDTAHKLFPKSLWEEIANTLWIHRPDKKDLAGKIPAPWHHYFINDARLIRAFLTFLASVPPETAQRLQMEFDGQREINIRLDGQIMTALRPRGIA